MDIENLFINWQSRSDILLTAFIYMSSVPRCYILCKTNIFGEAPLRIRYFPGYGHLTPQTQAGRLFLIVFAVVGIPLNILALATVGEHITIGICLGISRLSRLCFKKRTVRHINIKVMIISITLMVFMLFVGGSLYVSTEDWTYIDSIYYCFVALATIGFGDLVPNDGKPPNTSFGKALWGLRVLYISVGLSLVSTVFTAISNAIEEINALLGWPKKGKRI